MKLKKTIKIVVGIVVFFTLPSLLFIGYIYFKYSEDVPVGIDLSWYLAAVYLVTEWKNIVYNRS